MEWTCEVCGNVGFNDGGDGFFYCGRCNSQADGIMDTQINDEDLCNIRDGGIYAGSHRRVRQTPLTPAVPLSQVKLSQSQQFDLSQTMDDDDHVNVGDGVGPTGPSDFGSCPVICSYEDYYSEIRLRYVMGIQIMIQMQCKALVENFDASPHIVGLVGPIWLRFLAYTGVMADEWADQVLHESETQNQGEVDEIKHTASRSAEPHNILGQRAVMIWYRSLSSVIPLSYTLAISFLICHVARESILPTDILKGALEGKIPYVSVFVEIEKQLGPPPTACPINSSLMFRPTRVVSLQKLESMAASIAQNIRLELPPVNFKALASRYLQELSLPVSKILPQASCIYEWSKPRELHLSANEYRLPSRVCVMSILIVAIRMLYDLNGFGKWELSLSSSSSSPLLANLKGEREPTFEDDIEGDASSDKSSEDLVRDKRSKDFQNPGSDAVKLLKILEGKYNELIELRDTFDHFKDLPSYLQYCKDIVFAGSEPSFEVHEEERIIDDLWECYQSRKGSKPSEDEEIRSPKVSGMHNKRSREDSKCLPKDNDKFWDDGFTCDIMQEDDAPHGGYSSQSPGDGGNSSHRNQDTVHKSQLSVGCYEDTAIRQLKQNMEENRFCYIPPRNNVKRKDYIYYPRKKKEGAYLYAVHADYYILLRSCAKVAEVDVRTMHIGVLSFERRLQQLEERMNCCLRMKPLNDYCDICRDEVERHSENSVNFQNSQLRS